MTPELSGGVMTVTVILSILLVGLCLFLYCICNSEDSRRPNKYEYTDISYKSLYGSESESSEQREIGDINECRLVGLIVGSQENYINSIAQALVSSTKVIAQLQEVKLRIPFCITLQILHELIAGLNQRFPLSNSETNTNLIKKLAKHLKWSKISQQETKDGYGVLSAIIKDIYQEMKEGQVEIKCPLMIEVVHKINGLGTPNTIESHVGLSIELSGLYTAFPGVTLSYLIQHHFSPVIIDNDPSKTKQIIIFGQTPDTLLLHIQANKWNEKEQQTLKVDYFIMYSEYLSLEFNVTEELSCDE